MTHPRPISMITLQASKSHSSRTPKSEPPTYETPKSSCSSYTCSINWHLICSSWVSNSQAKPLDYECGSSDIWVRTTPSLLSQSNSDASHNYWDTTGWYSTEAQRKALAIHAENGENSNTYLGGEQHKNEKECAYRKGELGIIHISLYPSLFLFMVIVFVFWTIVVVIGWVCFIVIMGNVCF